MRRAASAAAGARARGCVSPVKTPQQQRARGRARRGEEGAERGWSATRGRAPPSPLTPQRAQTRVRSRARDMCVAAAELDERAQRAAQPGEAGEARRKGRSLRELAASGGDIPRDLTLRGALREATGVRDVRASPQTVSGGHYVSLGPETTRAASTVAVSAAFARELGLKQVRGAGSHGAG